MRSLWLIFISLFCLWLGLGFRISEGRSGQGLHQICGTDGQDFQGKTEWDIYHDNGRLSSAVGPDSERAVF